MTKDVAFYNGDNLISIASPMHEFEWVATSDVSTIRVYISKDNYTESATYKLYARVVNEPIHNRIVVTGNTLYQTIKNITDASISNQYDIILGERTYDVGAEFTEDEINSAMYDDGQYNDTFVGLSIKDGINIIGNGVSDKIIIKCEIPTTYSRDIRNCIATLNPKGNCTVENVTVIGKNIRYPVHDDFDYNRNARQIFKNCRFIEENSTGLSPFGCGTASGMKIYMENCVFEKGSVVFHTNSNFTKGSEVHLVNCMADSVYLGDSNSNNVCKAIFDNCKINKIAYEKINGEHEQFYDISGCGTLDVVMSVPSGIVYSVGDVFTKVSEQIAVGSVVDYTYTITTNLNNIYAIVIGYKDGRVYLQRSGYLTSDTIGLNGLNVGDYLAVDASGKVVSGGTKDNAIAIVKHTSNERAFAKMLI